MRVVSSRRLFCLSHAAFLRARAHLVPVQSQVRLGHSHGGPRAGPGATTAKCDVRANLVLFPSAQELPAQDQLKLLVLTPRCPERARIIHAERGRDLGLSGFRYGHCRSSSTRTQHKHITQSEISTAHRTILIALAVVHRRR